jgi:hypothetical protein
MPKRILVTGSRTWTDVGAIAVNLVRALDFVGQADDTILVSGACPNGADKLAEDVWEKYGGNVERHPAAWRVHGVFNKAAGTQRNQRMVDLGADVCVAFIHNNSPGATHCAAAAEAAGIRTVRITA